MSRFSLDTSIALRGFRRTPAFAITVVLILGLAIGMTTAMTSIFRSVLIQRLPVQDEERIVLPRVFDRAGVEIGMLPEQLKQYRQATRTLSNAAGVLHWGAADFPSGTATIPSSSSAPSSPTTSSTSSARARCSDGCSTPTMK